MFSPGILPHLFYRKIQLIKKAKTGKIPVLALLNYNILFGNNLGY